MKPLLWAWGAIDRGLSSHVSELGAELNTDVNGERCLCLHISDLGFCRFRRQKLPSSCLLICIRTLPFLC